MADFPVSQRFDKHLFKQHTDNGRSLISRILNKQIGRKQGEKKQDAPVARSGKDKQRHPE